MIPLALIAVGLTLVALGQLTKSEVTPVGKMDCGCGGGTECVTKNRSIDTGLWCTLGGGVLLLGGTVIAIPRLAKAKA